MKPILVRSGAVAAGLLLDRLIGELPNEAHPVVGFGKVMGRVEHSIWRDRRCAGVAYTAIGVLVGGVAGRLVRSTAITVAVCSAGRELRRAAQRIDDRLVAGDLEGARELLPWLVGRNPDGLDESAIAAAVIESLAENSVDAVIAPIWWGLIAGAPGAAIHRAINTMDAMVGYHNDHYERFGWASARLDDVANWIPARLFAGVVMALTPGRRRYILSLIRRDAPAHPSPNAGVAETAVAGALNRRLGGPVTYGEVYDDRPEMGEGDRPQPADIGRAIRLVDRVELVLVAVLGGIGLLRYLRRS